MPTTSNFGWTTPADTDLVKDGAAAIRTLGNGIDTSLVDLKGGTTGQVLSKASNTDLDFSWVAQDDSNAIQNALLTTTGDTIYASAASTPARLAIGTTGQVLTVAGGVPTWATAGGWSPNLTLLNAGGTALTGATTITVNVSSYDYYVFAIQNASSVNASSIMSIRINGDTGNNYNFVAVGNSNGNVSRTRSFNDNIFSIARMGNAAADTVSIIGNIIGGKNTGIKSINYAGYGSGATTFYGDVGTAYYVGTSAITSITIVSNDGNFDAGTIFIYGG